MTGFMTGPTAIEERLLRMPEDVRRKILQHSYAVEQSSESPDSIVISAALDGTMLVLTGEPQACGVCGKPHTLFRARSGRTCCWECDESFERARAALARAQAGL